jgi:iron transport multicopper oxidase
MIGINGQWPCPPIVLNYGDILVLNVVNSLGNQSTSIHFHGIHQRGTTFEDGPTFTTQCPIPPGNSFVYQFQALQVGTYWYHAHHGGQYIDGFRGALIINNPSPPAYGKIDQDLTLTLSDHHHDEAPYLINYYQSVDNTDFNGGTEPVPDSALMNEAQNVKFNVLPSKTYLFRIINIGAMAGFYLQFDQHTMTIIEVDGQYVQPYEVSQLFIAVAQRYGVLVQTKADKNQNYAIVASMNPQMFGENAFPASSTVSNS